MKSKSWRSGMPIILGALIIFSLFSFGASLIPVVNQAGAFTGSSYDQIPNDGLSTGISEGIKYHANVCTWIIRGDTGEVEENGCSSNLLTDDGAELIEDYLTAGAGTPLNYTGWCNATAGCGAAAAGDSTLENELTSGGFARVSGIIYDNGNGNWTLSTTATATVPIQTNKTGLFNQSSGGTLFAENTFTLADLAANDKIDQNWTIFVT